MTAPETSDAAAMDYHRFLKTVFGARGVLQVMIVSALLAFSLGSIVGLIPERIADRYARIHHDYDGPPCNSFDKKPVACQQGSDEAQSNAAWANFLMYMLALILNPVLGSVSDTRGRRPVLILCLFLSCIPTAVFLLVVALPLVNPTWYYIAQSLSGFVNFLSFAFAMLSDVTPAEYRAPAFGILLGVSYGGFAIGPSMPLFWNPVEAALIAFLLVFTAFVIAVFALPETLPTRQEAPPTEETTDLAPDDEPNDRSRSRTRVVQRIGSAVTRPLREAAILNRNCSIRLVAASSFLSSMVIACDTTLVIYYIEEQLNVRQEDCASMFFVVGLVGVIVQGGLMQPLVRFLGEKNLLLATFVCGILHNILYGVASSKATVYLALIVAQGTRTSLPLLSSLASKDVSTNEQGRIQGALSATNAVAYAVGPISMEYVYNQTKDNPHLGPGFMFMYAAGLFVVGAVLVSLMPAATQQHAFDEEEIVFDVDPSSGSTARQDLEEPLLEADGLAIEETRLVESSNVDDGNPQETS